MAVVKLLGISKVASQYIGEAGGGEGAKLKEFWQSAFNFQYLFDLVEQLFLSVRASLAFLVLWSFSIFKKAVSKRWGLAPLVYLGFGSVSKGWFCLGCIYLICWKWLLSLNSRFGSDVSLWLAAITLSQFHFLFYSSRPLPNIMVTTSSTNPSLVSFFILYAGTGPSVALSLLLVERSAHRLSSHRLFCHPRIQVNENSEVPKNSNVKLWSSFSLVGSFLSKHFQLLGGNWLSFWDLSFWWNFLLGEYLSKGAHTKSHTFLHWSRQQGWSWSVSSLSYSGHPSLWWSTPTFGDAQHGQRWTIRIFGWFFTIFFRLRLCTTMFTWTRVVIGELCHHYGQFELETFALSDEVGH